MKNKSTVIELVREIKENVIIKLPCTVLQRLNNNMLNVNTRRNNSPGQRVQWICSIFPVHNHRLWDANVFAGNDCAVNFFWFEAPANNNAYAID